MVITALTVGLTVTGTAIGTLIGGCIQTTKKGKEINHELEHDADKYGPAILKTTENVTVKTIERKLPSLP